MKKIAVLGSTGSIGTSTLDIVAEYPERFQIVALTAGNNLDRLEGQIRQFRPQVVAVLTAEDAQKLQHRLGPAAPEILHGVEGLIACAAAGEAELVVSAIVGAAGLIPTMAAIEAGKDVALANKETLVMAGSLVLAAVSRKGVRLHPVDSEHSAIFQAMAGHRHKDIRRLILTASGGPFRLRALSELHRVTPAEALDHPNWLMGRKITIDSATMMNKGLEIIEAHWLFGLPAERIAVHVHPQSIVHSMVEYIDGSVIAQMGIPDMRTPIAYALSYPERLPLQLPALDLCALGQLTFEPPDLQRFACLSLAHQALQDGGTSPAVLNAANEVSVDAFLSGEIGFLDIPQVIQATLDRHRNQSPEHVDEILRADRWARTAARRVIDSI